jgi:hypothetical protein
MRALLTLSVFALLATPSLADLKDEREISEGLITIGIAYEISEVCPEIGARRLRGLNALLGLRSRAQAMGYSSAEIEAYIDNDTEKDRLEAIARGRLAKLGAARGDTSAHCAVGRSEIAKNSGIGRFLYNR